MLTDWPKLSKDLWICAIKLLRAFTSLALFLNLADRISSFRPYSKMFSQLCRSYHSLTQMQINIKTRRKSTQHSPFGRFLIETFVNIGIMLCKFRQIRIQYRHKTRIVLGLGKMMVPNLNVLWGDISQGHQIHIKPTNKIKDHVCVC